jgi:membrane protease YdiL (CAAX protease family)
MMADDWPDVFADRDEGGLEFVAPEAPDDGLSVVKTPKFCNRCGARWDPAWVLCPKCAPARPVSAGPMTKAQVLGKIPKSLSSAIWLYMVLLVTSIGSALAVLYGGAGEAGADIGFSIVLVAVTVIWCLASRRTVGPGMRETGGWQWYPGAVGIGIGTFLVVYAVVAGLKALLDFEVYSYSKPFLDAGYGWPMVILIIAVVPGIFEELAFRGVILSGMEKALTSREALIVSTMMFAILHLNVISLPHLAVMGFVLGYVRQRSGSIYPCMLVHFTHNLLCVITDV